MSCSWCEAWKPYRTRRLTQDPIHVNGSNRVMLNVTDKASSSHLEMLLVCRQAKDNVTQRCRLEEGYDGTAKQMGIPPGSSRPLWAGRPADEAEDVGRVLCEHGLPPQARLAAAEWASARWGAAPPGSRGTTAHL